MAEDEQPVKKKIDHCGNYIHPHDRPGFTESRVKPCQCRRSYGGKTAIAQNNKVNALTFLYSRCMPDKAEYETGQWNEHDLDNAANEGNINSLPERWTAPVVLFRAVILGDECTHITGRADEYTGDGKAEHTGGH